MISSTEYRDLSYTAKWLKTFLPAIWREKNPQNTTTLDIDIIKIVNRVKKSATSLEKGKTNLIPIQSFQKKSLLNLVYQLGIYQLDKILTNAVSQVPLKYYT